MIIYCVKEERFQNNRAALVAKKNLKKRKIKTKQKKIKRNHILFNYNKFFFSKTVRLLFISL